MLDEVISHQIRDLLDGSIAATMTKESKKCRSEFDWPIVNQPKPSAFDSLNHVTAKATNHVTGKRCQVVDRPAMI